MFPPDRMVLLLFLGSHGTLVAVSVPFMMPLRDSDIPMNVPFTFCNKQPLAERNVQGAAEIWAIVQTTHGLQTWTGAADEVQRQKSPTTPPRQAIHGDIVRRDTSTYGVLVGRETIALTPVEGHFTTTPTKKRNPHKNGLNSGRYEGRGPTKQ
jgi:hypothetical protein